MARQLTNEDIRGELKRMYAQILMLRGTKGAVRFVFYLGSQAVALKLPLHAFIAFCSSRWHRRLSWSQGWPVYDFSNVGRARSSPIWPSAQTARFLCLRLWFSLFTYVINASTLSPGYCCIASALISLTLDLIEKQIITNATRRKAKQDNVP